MNARRAILGLLNILLLVGCTVDVTRGYPGSKVLQFLALVFGHWQIWLSGSGVGGVVVVLTALFERMTGKTLPKKAYMLIFVVAFLVGSCFLAWNDENRRADELSGMNKTLTMQVGKLRDESSRQTGTIQTLQNQIRDQQTTINDFIVQLGKKLTPEPLKLSPLLLENNPADHSVKFIVLTNKSITPVRLVVDCDGGITTVDSSILGAAAHMYGGWGGRFSDRQYGVGILSPAWTPTSPLLLTVRYRQNAVGVCSFAEQ